jgi:hypothetical protein
VPFGFVFIRVRVTTHEIKTKHTLKYDWREDGAYRQREEETAAPFFGGFGGG